MGTRLYVNNYVAVTTADITDSGTTILVSNNTNLPTLTGTDYYYLTLSSNTSTEIVKVTARTGSILTVVRAQEGTTAIAWLTGSPIDMRYTATSIVNSSGNSFANNYVSGYETTATAAGTTTLTVTSPRKQHFTGSTTQTVVLPVVTTLSLGHEFEVVNESSGVVTVQSSGANTVRAMAANTTAKFTCILITGTTAASWSVTYVNSVVPSLGTGVSTFLATPSSANLAAALTDETGSGANVFATSPALVSPTANSFIDGYSTTATAAGTTTLTVSSNKTQTFTGSTTQTCVLPVVSTLVLGTIYIITNLSTGVVTVQSSGANTVQAMQANTTLIVQSNATSGTGASVWNVVAYYAAASGMTGSGSVARATSPTLVTPVLGAASATSMTFSSTSGIIGTTTNDAAATGSVGEEVESIIAQASAVALTTATQTNVTSISLTAGDWDVWGNVTFVPVQGVTTVTLMLSSINTTSATLPASSNYASYPSSGTLVTNPGLLAPGRRLTLSATTTVYLVCYTVFAISTLGACGGLFARRRR